ncbi:MAG: hypothetical protein MHM6MM_007649 [Cercozoa sp. M6MM]
MKWLFVIFALLAVLVQGERFPGGCCRAEWVCGDTQCMHTLTLTRVRADEALARQLAGARPCGCACAHWVASNVDREYVAVDALTGRVAHNLR